jgi:hypothetical protein
MLEQSTYFKLNPEAVRRAHYLLTIRMPFLEQAYREYLLIQKGFLRGYTHPHQFPWCGNAQNVMNPQTNHCPCNSYNCDTCPDRIQKIFDEYLKIAEEEPE